MDWQNLPTINATRVTLRWISEDDVDALYRIFSDPQVMRYWSTPPLADRNAAVLLLNEIHENFHSQTALKWGIALRSDDTLIGTATLFNFENHRAEIGYGLDRSHWGNGYMHEALQALIAYAFQDLGLHRIEADVDPRNSASIRTVERLGFQREGYLRERWQVNGEIQDALLYGLLRPEWSIGAWCLVLCTWCFVLGCVIEVFPCSRLATQVRTHQYQAQSARYKEPITKNLAQPTDH